MSSESRRSGSLIADTVNSCARYLPRHGLDLKARADGHRNLQVGGPDADVFLVVSGSTTGLDEFEMLILV